MDYLPTVDMIINEKDFAGFLLDFQTRLAITPNKRITDKTVLRLYEFNSHSNCLTGRNLLFQVLSVEKNFRSESLKDQWILHLFKAGSISNKATKYINSPIP